MNVITRLRSRNSDSGTRGWSALRSTTRNDPSRTTAAAPAPITHGSAQPRGGPWVNTSTPAVQARVASSAPVTSSLSRSWRVSSRRVSAIATMRMPIGQVDQEGQPPRDDGQRAAEHQAEHRAHALHGRRDRHGPVAGVPDGVGGGDQRQPGRGGDGGADALDRAGGDEQRAVGGQAAGGRGDGEDADAGDEGPLVPDRVADAAAEQQQATEGQHVGGDHPALAGVGQVQVGLHARQRDHHDGAVQGGHQLHAGDRDDRDPEHWWKAVWRRVANR